MQIRPRKFDYDRWQKTFDASGDLLFSDKDTLDLLKSTGAMTLTKNEVKAQAGKVWSLNHRSWYRYALENSDFCAWVPPKTIEKLPAKLLKKIASEQIRIGVPTLLQKEFLSIEVGSKLLEVENRFWLTSAGWQGLSKAERGKVTRAWFAQAKIDIRSSAKLDDLTALAKQSLDKTQCSLLLNIFSDSSGPNCFALVAEAISPNKTPRLHRLWLHWPSIARFLKEMGFCPVESNAPEAEDVLVYIRNGEPIHGAYYLGDGIYFEKAGQDFYEPYRVERLSNCREEWPSCQMQIWRKEQTSLSIEKALLSD
jgi:hypothetical protein